MVGARFGIIYGMKTEILIVAALFAASAYALPNGGVWKDTEGVHVNAHGGEQEVETDCYWHWMNGNISKEGITADLEYMKAGGIEAAVFDGAA